MARVRMIPPVGSIDPQYGGERASDNGVLVFTRDVDAMKAQGWTRAPEKSKTPPKEQPKKGLTEAERETALAKPKSKVAPKKKAKE